MRWKCFKDEGMHYAESRVELYRLGDKRPQWSRTLPSVVEAACPTERYIFTVRQTGVFVAFPRAQFEPSYTLTLPNDTYTDVILLQSTPPRLVLLGQSGTLYYLNPPENAVHRLKISAKALTLGVLGGGQTLLVADASGRVYAIRERRVVGQWEGAVGGVNGLAPHPKEPLVAGAGVDGIIRIWEYPSGKLLRALAGHRWEVLDVVFAESDRLLSIGTDGQVLVWRTTGTQVPETFLRSPAPPTNAQWYRDPRGRIWLLTPTQMHQLNLRTAEWQSFTLQHSQKKEVPQQ